MRNDYFDCICRLTLELVRLRQNECKHLCIENLAPKIFGRLLREFVGCQPQEPEQEQEP